MKLLILLGSLILSLTLQAEPEVKLNESLGLADFARAAKELDLKLQAKPKDGTLLYHRALVAKHLKKYADVQKLCDRIIALPKSEYRHKARFLKAVAYETVRDFKNAEVIYREESERLLDQKELDRSIEVMVKLSELLISEEEMSKEKRKPDYDKAVLVLKKALELDLTDTRREDILFRMAACYYKKGDFDQCLNSLNTYFLYFDKDWQWKSVYDSNLRQPDTLKFKQKGKNYTAAHQLHLKAMKNRKYNFDALSKYLKIIKDDPEFNKLAEDARSAVIESFGPLKNIAKSPNVYDYIQYELLVRDFLKIHSGSPKAPLFAWQLGTFFNHNGHYEKALEVFTDFFEGKKFKYTEDDANKNIEEISSSLQEWLKVYRPQSLIHIAAIHSSLSNIGERRKALEQYLKLYPDGPMWTYCQQELVSMEWNAALKLKSQKKYEEARKAFREFIKNHRRDTRLPEAFLLMAETHVVSAGEKWEKEKAEAVKEYNLAVKVWEELFDKYPASKESDRALLLTANLFSEKLERWKEAEALYKKLTARPSVSQEASLRLAQFSRSTFSLSAEKTVETGMKMTVEVSSRNLKEITFKLYKLDLEAFFRKKFFIGGIDKLDTSLIEADNTWTVKINNPHLRGIHKQTVEIPLNEAGACIINVSADKQEQNLLMIRSDIKVQTVASRHESLIFVQKEGKPLKGAKVILASHEKVIHEGVTDEKGFLLTKYEDVKKNLNVFVLEKGSAVSAAVHGLDRAGINTELKDQLIFVPRRKVFAASDKLEFALALRLAEDKKLILPNKEKWTVEILSPKGRLFYEGGFSFSDSGTASLNIPSPESTSPGNYTFLIKGGKKTFKRLFTIGMPQSEDIKVLTDTDGINFLEGSKVILNAQALDLLGSPLAGEWVSGHVNNRIFYVKTDKDGRFSTLFTPDEKFRSSYVNFTISKVGSYQVNKTSTVYFHKHDLKIDTRAGFNVAVEGRATPLTFDVSTYKNEPAAVEFSVEVFNINDTEKVVQTHKIKSDNDGKASLDLVIPKAGNYGVRAVNGAKTYSAEVYLKVIGPESPDKLVLFPESFDIKVGAVSKATLYSFAESGMAVMTVENGSILEKKLISLKKGEIPVEYSSKFPGRTIIRIKTLLKDTAVEAVTILNVSDGLDMEIVPDEKLLGGKSNKLTLRGKAPGDNAAFAFLSSSSANPFSGAGFSTGSLRTARFQNESFNGMRSRLICTVTADFGDRSQQELSDNMSEALNNMEFQQTAQQQGFRPVRSRYRDNSIKHVSGPVFAFIKDLKAGKEFTVSIPSDFQKLYLHSITVAADGRIGYTAKEVKVSWPLKYELTVPEEMKEGDEFNPGLQLFTVEEKSEVKAKLTAFAGGKQFYEDTHTFTVGNVNSKRHFFETVKIPLTFETEFRLSLTYKGRTETFTRIVSTVPAGTEFTESISGAAAKSFKFNLAEAALNNRDYQKLTLRVFPDASSFLLSSALSGVGQKYKESHDADRLYGLLALLERQEKFKWDETSLKKLNESIRVLISRLVLSQKDNGSWNSRNPLRDSTLDLFETASSYRALARAKNNGFKFYGKALELSTGLLKKVIQDLDHNESLTSSFLLMCLCENEEGDFTLANRLYRERDKLSQLAMVSLAHSMISLDHADLAEKLYELLLKKSEGRKWQKTSSRKHDITPIRIEALAVSLLNRLGKDADSGELLKKAGIKGFFPFQASGDIIEALSGNLKAEKSAQKQEVALSAGVLSTKGEMNGKPLELTLLSKTLPAAFNVNFNNGKIYYLATLSTWGINIQTKINGFNRALRNRKYYRYDRLAGGYTITREKARAIEFGEEITVYSYIERLNNHQDGRLLKILEKIPTGFEYVTNSFSNGNNLRLSVRGNELHFRLRRSDLYYQSYSYRIRAAIPGKYKVSEAVFADELRNDVFSTTSGNVTLTVLPPGKKTTDAKKMARNELLYRARWNFQQKNWKEALAYLEKLREMSKSYSIRETSRMRLWIHTLPEFLNDSEIVDAFEILQIREPNLEIPFIKVMQVAKSYAKIGEFERAAMIHQAVIDAGFFNQADISAIIEDSGQFTQSLHFQKQLWFKYPDSHDVRAMLFALAQIIYNKSGNAEAIKKGNIEANPFGGELTFMKLEKEAMLNESISLLHRYLNHYPESDQADAAAFSLTSAWMDLEKFDRMIDLTAKFRKRFSESKLASSFPYMAALGYFWKNMSAEALKEALSVAQGDSKDKDLASYIAGQIYHAENNVEKAIEWYNKIKKIYPDAGEAVKYFKRSYISLPEITLLKPGKPVKLKITSRNISDATLQIYKVDLMKLYLREKNLKNIRGINLAGISPLAEETVKLGNGRDFADVEKEALLKLKDEGAYLVICRGGEHFSSGLILISPLELDIQEEPAIGVLRVNVRNRLTGKYVPKVEVKAVSSMNKTLKEGETDLRGIVSVQDLRGQVTVIAREGTSRYAFYRGSKIHGTVKQQEQQRASQQKMLLQKQLESLDYKQNLIDQNNDIQLDNWNKYDMGRRGNRNKGVQIKAIRKK